MKIARLMCIIILLGFTSAAFTQQAESPRGKHKNEQVASRKVLKVFMMGSNTNQYYEIVLIGYFIDEKEHIVSDKLTDDTLTILFNQPTNMNLGEVYQYNRDKKYYRKTISLENEYTHYDSICLNIITPENNYTYLNFNNDLKQKDTVVYIINYEQLGFKEQEEQQKQEEQKLLIDLIDTMNTKAGELENYYDGLLNGKSYNKISDILYDEGFSRDYSFSSTTNTIFKKQFSYDRNKFIVITITVWYSYGYGSLYYTITHKININGRNY